MKVSTGLNVIAGTSGILSLVLLLGSWPLQWFGSGFFAVTLWFVGLVLIPITGVCILAAVAMAVKGGGAASKADLAWSAVILLAAVLAWIALFQWLAGFE